MQAHLCGKVGGGGLTICPCWNWSTCTEDKSNTDKTKSIQRLKAGEKGGQDGVCVCESVHACVCVCLHVFVHVRVCVS